jgi:hypothetical protein
MRMGWAEAATESGLRRLRNRETRERGGMS